MSDTANIQEFLAHSDWLKELARGIVRDPDSAEEVVQETWLRTLRRPPRTMASPRGWLQRVATNSARGLGRSERARRHREDAVRTEARVRPADEVVERAQIHALLAQEVLGLDEPYRSTVLLRYFEDQDVDTVAQLHAVSPSTVRTRTQRALAELRRRCERTLGPDDASHGGLLALAKWCQESPRAAMATSAPSIGAWALWSAAVVLVGITALAIAPFFSSAGDPTRAAGERASSTADAPRSARTARAASAGTQLGQRADAERVALEPVAFARAGRVTELACDGVLESDRPAAEVAVTLRARVVQTWLDGETQELSVEERARASTNQLRIAWSRKGAKESGGATRTDANGIFELPFELPAVRSGELLLLRAEVEEDDTWRSSRLDLALRPEEVADGLFTHLHVRRAAHGYLTGRVLTTHRNSVEGAKIRFRGQKGLRPSDGVTAVSAADGSYRLGPLRGFGSLELAHPSFVGFDHGSLIRKDTGGWASSDLFVVPSGVLRVRVLRGEAPVPNAAVRLWTDARSIRSQKHTRIFRDVGWNMPNSGTQGSPIEARTDAEGWAELCDVWVGKRLQIEVEVGGVKRMGARVRDDRILFGDLENHANPLALHDREPRELEAVLFDEVVVRGRVLGSDGTVQAGARIRCEFDDQRGRNVKPLHLHTKTDMEGRFELTFAGEHAETRFLAVVSADSASAPALQGLGYLGESTAPAAPAESANVGFVPATFASGDVSELEVVLGPGAVISGEVALPDGQAAVGHVFADVHAGHDHVSMGTNFENGRFEITGLCADTAYDLRFEQLAERENRQLPIAVRTLDKVPAGTSDLKVEFDAPGQVEVTVRLDGKAKGALLYRWAPEVEGDPTPRLPARSVVAGTALTTDPDFEYVLDGQLKLQDGSTDLPPLPAGRLQVVLLAHDDEMRPYYWSILGPVAIHPGQHTITFELSHTGSVRGRIVPEEGATTTNEAVSLVDKSGRSFLLGAGPHWFQPTHQFESGVLPVGPDGSFEVYAAPVGTWRLRFGSVAQLARGEFSHEREVEVTANETLWLELGER